MRRSGLRRLGWESWQATDADPLFVFVTGFLRAAYIILEVADADQTLDPRIYIDFGKGFEPDDEIELKHTRDGLYVIALRSFGRVHHVRFDPSSYPSRFRFRAFIAYDEKSVRAFVGGRLRAAARGERAAPLCETIARPGAPELSGVGARVAKVRGATPHFEQVIAMANARYAGAPAWTGERPAFSFVTPVYDAPALYLDQLLDSFRIQRAGAYELILSDDGSTSRETIDWLERHRDTPHVTILRAAQNGGIAVATNSGLAAARGDWVGFIDHDDALAPYAVDALLETIERTPGAQFVFTDEIVADAKLQPKHYSLKPAFDPVLLSGVNYVNHLSLYRRERLQALGGLRRGYEGSQDYDLLLRYTRSLATEEIVHLPYPAYLWRRDGKSYSVSFLDRATTSARRSLAESYAVDGAPATVEPARNADLHRVRFSPKDDAWPLVSIIVPSRDSFALVSRLFDDLTLRTDYPRMEILVVDNGTKDARVLDLYEQKKAAYPFVSVDIVEETFNFSRQVNRGLRAARGDCMLLLNNDIEVMDAGWLKEMVSCLAYPSTGIVGARLLYPNGTLQHAGVVMGLGSVAGHWFCGMPGDYPGPMGRLDVRQSMAAVTGACMLVTRACLEAVGGLDDENFAIAYNDTDYCMRAGRAGFRVVWTPFATLTHHESSSRGSDETNANIARFRREQDALRKKYDLVNYVDPAFNPWYSRDNAAPRLQLLSSLPPGRHFRV
ncbi:glycosyltransferase family 2 protein [Methylosinus sp. LW4]|uniref:glycosyltransferase family 2 protein n=1 Tax=Methylosinus sp. LW4 TaxID=136993 RepID=UPI00039D2A35|nr:glycosyltransferase [Methylosinus sp. LW4]